MPDSVTKRCHICGEVKPLSEFSIHTPGRPQRRSECKKCRAEDQSRRRDADPEKWLEIARRSHASHREVRNQISREWYQDNQDRVQNYRQANRDREAERTRQAYEANRAAVFAHYGTACACCGTTENLTIDHIAGGGTRHREELFGWPGNAARFDRWLIEQGFPPGYQTLCLSCNCSKWTGEACRLPHVIKPEVTHE